VFDIDQSGAILGKVWSGRDVPRPTQGLVGSEPDLPTVGLDGLQTSADVCQAASKKLLFHTSRRRLVSMDYVLHILSSRKVYSIRAYRCSSSSMRTPNGLVVVEILDITRLVRRVSCNTSPCLYLANYRYK
jgi:hypothetical protein